jgi:hypothetical protein
MARSRHEREGRVRKMEMRPEPVLRAALEEEIGSEISEDETNLEKPFELFFFALVYFRNVSAQLPH